MNEPMAIVDLETTGTSATYGRIIEIGIIRVEKGKVKRVYETLVNPECYIHPMIEQLTGISNRDVVGGAGLLGGLARSGSVAGRGGVRCAQCAVRRRIPEAGIRTGGPSLHAPQSLHDEAVPASVPGTPAARSRQHHRAVRSGVSRAAPCDGRCPCRARFPRVSEGA